MAPSNAQLTLELGAVALAVADLERSLHFYEHVLGLALIDRDGDVARLGVRAPARTLVVLHANPGLRRTGRPTRLGLYHVALRLPDRAALGRFAAHVARAGVPVGAGDHLVSEAFYLSDPDGLGVEVYADRPRTHWYDAAGALRMTTDPVDVHGVIAAGAGEAWSGVPAGTTVGHVHLHTDDLARAEALYAALGLEVTTRDYPGALFMAADGYHHHLGLNTWAGPSARPAPDDEARLLWWSIVYRQRGGFDAAQAALAALGAAASVDAADTLSVADPSGPLVRLSYVATAT